MCSLWYVNYTSIKLLKIHAIGESKENGEVEERRAQRSSKELERARKSTKEHESLLALPVEEPILLL